MISKKDTFRISDYMDDHEHVTDDENDSVSPVDSQDSTEASGTINHNSGGAPIENEPSNAALGVSKNIQVTQMQPPFVASTKPLSNSSIGSSKTINGIRRPSDNLLSKMLLQETNNTTNSVINNVASTPTALQKNFNHGYIDSEDAMFNVPIALTSASILDVDSSQSNETTASSTRTSTATSTTTAKRYHQAGANYSSWPTSHESIVTNNTSISGDSNCEILDKKLKNNDLVLDTHATTTSSISTAETITTNSTNDKKDTFSGKPVLEAPVSRKMNTINSKPFIANADEVSNGNVTQVLEYAEQDGQTSSDEDGKDEGLTMRSVSSPLTAQNLYLRDKATGTRTYHRGESLSDSSQENETTSVEDPLHSTSTVNEVSNVSVDSISTIKGKQTPDIQRYMFNNGMQSTNSVLANTNDPLASSNGKFYSASSLPGNNNSSQNFFSSNSRPLTPNEMAMMQSYKMTPSQRLRMRREQNKNSVKNSIKYKEFYYDKHESIEKLRDQHGNIHSNQPSPLKTNTVNSAAFVQNNNISNMKNMKNKPASQSDDFLVWNVPVALNSVAFHQTPMMHSKAAKPSSSLQYSTTIGTKNASSTMGPQPSLGKRANSTSVIPSNPLSNIQVMHMAEMPASPIPGITAKGDKMNTLYDSTTKNLSQMYLSNSKSFSQVQLQTRMNSMDSLPQMVKTAGDEGLEDLKLVSDEKLKNVTSTRPMWLPIKSPREIKKHEFEISKTMSMVSIDKLNFNRKLDELPKKIADQKAKFDDIINKELQLSTNENSVNTINRNSLGQSLQNILWDCPNVITLEERLATYKKLTYFSLYENHFSSQLYNRFDDLYNNKYRTTEFNQTKLAEIDKLIKLNLVDYANVSEEDSTHNSIPENLITLIKLKMLTPAGLQNRDIIMFNILLKFYNADNGKACLETVWELNEVLSIVCFNDSVVEKFNEKIMSKSGPVYKYLSVESNFDQEFQTSNLKFDNFFHILDKLPESLTMWVLDVILVSNIIVFKSNNLEHYHKKLVTKLTEIKLTNPSSNSSSTNKYENMLFEYWNRKYMTKNYKVLVALVLNVLLNYHFGFNNFDELKKLSNKSYNLLGLPSSRSSSSLDNTSSSSVLKKHLSYRSSISSGGSRASMNSGPTSTTGTTGDKQHCIDGDEFVLIEGFLKKWLHYYKKF
ncbi:hypothetical protein ACO0RG_003925 [Hanseniaspora osmophila]|uniref:Protein SBE22 n=1 Tax=Hanseniaspora osmophila TaxID=56408 RepID=A0A1E5RAE0_9ASCO|nr:Protein SBE22 [Hanseniaspora osmophila]